MMRLKQYWTVLPQRWRRLIVWGGGLFAAYTIIGFLILPFVVRWVGVRQITKQLDRQAQIDSVRVNPFVLSLSIRRLLITDKDGQPFVSWGEFYANFQLSSLFRRPWVFKEVRLDHPFVRAQMNKDNSLNFSDLLKKFSVESSKSKSPSQPLYLEVEQLSIMGAQASVTDMTPRVPFRRVIGPVQLTVTRFRTEPNSQNPYSFSGTTDSGERFAWSGRFSLDPVRSSGEFALEGVSLPKYAALYQDLTRFDITNGTISIQSTYDVALTPSTALATVTNASFLLEGLKVIDRSNATDVLALDALRVREMSADLSSRTAEIGGVMVQGGRVNVLRDRDDRINLLELSQPAEDMTNAPGGVLTLLKAATNVFAAFLGSTNLWSARLHELNVTNCEVRCEDLANRRPVRLELDQIAVNGRELSNLPGSNQTVSVSLRWNTNGLIRVDSSMEIAPPTAAVTLSVDDLELSPLDPYLEPFLDVFIVNSRLSVHGNLDLKSHEDNLPEVTFRGDVQLDDFATRDGVMSEELLRWRSVQLSGMKAGLQPPTVAVKNLTLLEPLARVAIETNRTINLLSALRVGATNESAQMATLSVAPANPERPAGSGLGQKFGGFLRKLLASGTNGPSGDLLPKITVDSLTISNGGLQFFDRSTQPRVTALIEELNGTLKGLSSEELRQAEINLKGLINRSGQFEVDGKLNPLTKNTPTDLKMQLHAVDLQPASPYAARFLGYRLDGGKLDLQVSYTVSQKQLKAQNVVGIDRLTLGGKVDSPDATHLPVRLAVALLKDRNGKIELDVPIEGNLDDPEFHYGKVISRVLVNIITKLVTSPFAVLGAVFGGKGEEVAYQDFEPGGVDLLESQADKLAALINGLTERPGLQLEIEGSFDPQKDTNALRRQKLRHQFQTQKWTSLRRSDQAQTSADQVSLSENEYAAYLKEAYRAMLQTNSAVNKISGANPNSTAKPTEPSSDRVPASEAKGASALLNRPASGPDVQATDMERALAETTAVTDEDLNQLALERARRTQQKILGTGKVDSSRVSLRASDSTTPAGRAARVYFHLQ